MTTTEELPNIFPEDERCPTHGSPTDGKYCLTQHVLALVSYERTRQFAEYGTNNDLADGTGPEVKWMPRIPVPHTPSPALQIERICREEYEETEARDGKVTWMQLVREEVAEAFAEEDPKRLSAELLQVAALCVSWVETIAEREAAKMESNGIVT